MKKQILTILTALLFVSSATAAQLTVYLEDSGGSPVEQGTITVEGINNNFYETKDTGDDSYSSFFDLPAGEKYQISAETDTLSGSTESVVNDGDGVTLTLTDDGSGGGDPGNEGDVFSITEVTASNFEPEKGEETELRANIQNNWDTQEETTVQWYAVGNGEEINLGSRGKDIQGGETETLRRSISWQQLKDKGLEVGNKYDLKATAADNTGEIIDERTGDTAYIELQPYELADLKVYVDDENGNTVNDPKVIVSSATFSKTIDNQNNPEFENLEPGSYGIDVEKSGYQTVERTVELESGQNEERFTLESTDSNNPVEISEYGADYRGSGKVRFNLKLNQDVDNDYSCRVSENNQITERDTQENNGGIMEKVSGSNKRFRVDLYFEEGDYTRYLGCMNENGEQITDAKKVEFSVDLDDDISVSPNYPINNDEVENPVEFSWNVDNSQNIDLEYDLEITDDNGDTVETVDGIDETTHTLDNDLKTGDYEWSVEAIDNNGDVRDSSSKASFKVVDDSEYELEADFDYSPSSPEEGEAVEFESTSSGDIEEWNWDFDDGNVDEGETVTHTFDDEGEYLVELEVDDGENTDTETKLVEVGQQAGACNIDVGDLHVDPEKIPTGAESEVSVTVENNGQEQDIVVTFEVNSDEHSVEEDTLESGETEEYSITISPEDDVGLRAIVETDGSGDNPCSYYRWDRTDYLPVYQAGTNNDATFNFNVEDDDGDELENVRIRGENGETFTRYTDDDGEASADVERGTYEITASKPGYESETKTRTIDSGETKTVDFTLDRKEDAEDIGELSILTEDLDEEPIEDVQITAENGDDETEYTDENGRAFFYLEEGDYTVTAEKDGYHTQTRDVEIEAGERTPVLFKMTDEDEDSVRITNLDYSDTVCRGDTLEVTVSIANSRDSDELVTFRGEGLGSDSKRSVVTKKGETITRIMRFTNVQGSGNQDFTISIDNSVHDLQTGTVEVERCGFEEPDQEATGLTAEVSPRTVQVGETVRVQGFVDGIRGSAEVKIESNGNTIARTSTDRSGYYSTYTRFNSPGTKNIEVSSGGLTRSRTVEVLATANVGGIYSPRQVFESEEFEICADVSSQVQADVVLLRNGEVIESKKGNGRVCFTTEAGEPGTAIYEIRALTSGTGGSSTKSIEVLEQGNEVESFPDQLASVESGGSIARVELYNTNDDLRTYDLSLSGIDERWYSQSDDTVKLSSGERDTVYFYLTPRAEGEYRPTLRVDSNGETIYDNEIILEAEGTDRPQRVGLVQRIIRFFTW
ncbi:MAG: PKD repeat protein [Candidatus Nanohaloarchaea archaeon]|jgi:PKD repeat protein